MKSDPLRLESIDEILNTQVKPARWPAIEPVELLASHPRGEPVPYRDAVAGKFEPFAIGDAWGPLWGTTWFRVTGRVPGDWAGRDCSLMVHLGYGGPSGFGAEGQVWIAGQPTQGVGPNHQEVRIGSPAAGGETIDLYIEAAANPSTPSQDPGPLLLAEPDGEPRLTLKRCHLAVVDREVEALVRDWKLVRELAAAFDSERAEPFVDALERASSRVAPGVDAASVRAARAELAPLLERGDAARSRTHLAVGNSHLDTAWLWPLRETHRKAARTFSTAATMLDGEPDYRFAASQAQQFEWVRDEHPSLWERLRAHVAAGRFDVVGSMWVEPDCNLPSGESLVRQIVYGKRFFREAFGVDTRGLWLPDVFGYSAALPQILSQAGIDWFLTQKISWNDTNRFPHHTFWWEGLDGTRIFSHFPPADTYTGTLSVANLHHGERRFAQREIRDLSMYLYGHGDGGGGPDQDMLERARRLRDLEGVGRVELSTAEDAMARIRAEGDDAELPVWVGELYLEFHRGTYTTHAAVKQGNRRLEGALREAETWALAAREAAGVEVPVTALERAWKQLLLHQFHDILPGTSIHWVYQDTLADYAEVQATTEEVQLASLDVIASRVETRGATRPVLVTNGLGFARDAVVEVEGELHRLTAPPCGWAVHDLDRPADFDTPPVECGERWMDNGLLRVEWDEAGLLRSLRHAATGREAIAPGAAGNLLQLMDDHPQPWDAWDIERSAFDTAVDLTDVETLEWLEQNETRARLRVVRGFGASRIDQELWLVRGSGRLEVHCSVDWHEEHKLLKVAFPLHVRADVARHEIQFGHVERPTHENTSWDRARYETCAHTWVDLSEDGFGVALLNDCKYGHDVSGNVVRLSLLRAPTWPDPLADRGQHHFAYALYPHAGPPTSGGVIAQAHAFNAPLGVRPITAGSERTLPARHSLLEVDDPGVVVTALKAADDGQGCIVRLHEAFGGRRRVRLRSPGAVQAERVDLLEQPLDAPALPVDGGTLELELRPFELVTLRLLR